MAPFKLIYKTCNPVSVVPVNIQNMIKNGKNINITMYNSDIDKDKVKEYGVRGFPSLFIEKNNNRETFPHRTYDKISDYLNNL